MIIYRMDFKLLSIAYMALHHQTFAHMSNLINFLSLYVLWLQTHLRDDWISFLLRVIHVHDKSSFFQPRVSATVCLQTWVCSALGLFALELIPPLPLLFFLLWEERENDFDCYGLHFSVFYKLADIELGGVPQRTRH
jgi:hypothetical protein